MGINQIVMYVAHDSGTVPGEYAQGREAESVCSMVYAGILHDVKSTHASDDDWVCDKQVATARANAYVDFALAVAKKLGLFASETDLQETIRFWKYYQRVQ